MEYVSAILLTIGLCTDVLIASVSKGVCIRKLTWGKFFAVSGIFALIQGGCALISYQLNEETAVRIRHIDHWCSFLILILIGAVMLIRSYHDVEMDQKEYDLKYAAVLMIGLAVSVDTLPIITTDTFSKLSMWAGSGIIAIETLLMAILGIWIGHKLGARYRYKSEFAGGILFVVLGIKMLAVGIFQI